MMVRLRDSNNEYMILGRTVSIQEHNTDSAYSFLQRFLSDPIQMESLRRLLSASTFDVHRLDNNEVLRQLAVHVATGRLCLLRTSPIYLARRSRLPEQAEQASEGAIPVGPTEAFPGNGNSSIDTRYMKPVVHQQAEPVAIRVADGRTSGRNTSPVVAGTPATGVPREVFEHLLSREGWRKDVYLDSMQRITVGMGHLLSEKERKIYKVGDILPRSTLESLAQSDALKAYNAASAQAATIGVPDQGFVAALTSVNYQLGPGWNNEHKKTWAHMVAHDWENAALEAGNSSWAKQTPVRVRDFQGALRALIDPSPSSGGR